MQLRSTSRVTIRYLLMGFSRSLRALFARGEAHPNNAIRQADSNGRERHGQGLKITVFDFFFVVLLVYLLINWFQLNGTDGYYFEISSTFRTGDNFSLIDFIFVDIEVGLTFRAMNHRGLHIFKLPC